MKIIFFFLRTIKNKINDTIIKNIEKSIFWKLNIDDTQIKFKNKIKFFDILSRQITESLLFLFKENNPVESKSITITIKKKILTSSLINFFYIITVFKLFNYFKII